MSALDHQTDWEQHVSAWQASDLSAAAYCREHALVYHQFYYWRQKLATPSPSDVVAPGFARVVPQSVMPSKLSEEVSGLKVALPNGITISGLHAGNMSLLGLLLREL